MDSQVFFCDLEDQRLFKLDTGMSCPQAVSLRKTKKSTCPISNINIAYIGHATQLLSILVLHIIFQELVRYSHVISVHGVSSMRQVYPTYIIVPYGLISLSLRNRGYVLWHPKLPHFSTSSCLHLYVTGFSL